MSEEDKELIVYRAKTKECVCVCVLRAVIHDEFSSNRIDYKSVEKKKRTICLQADRIEANQISLDLYDESCKHVCYSAMRSRVTL
jgi:hypothetical protein